jgi:hypothetical protein
VNLFTDAWRRRVQLVVPAFIAGETCYMLERGGQLGAHRDARQLISTVASSATSPK